MAVKKLVIYDKHTSHTPIDILIQRAQQAQSEFSSLSQSQIDHIVHRMALAGMSNHTRLAKLSVEETGRGVFEDKVMKNSYAAESVYHSIKYDKTVGVIEANPHESFRMIAEPVGILAALTPIASPTSTTMIKSLLAMKARNPIIFSFHPSAQQCSIEAAAIMRAAAIEAGAPAYCIQWIEQTSIDAALQLISRPEVSKVLATGGRALLQAACGTGKPVLGVAPGNIPCFIERTANLKQAITDLILSRTFDNGMNYESEQAVIIEAPIYDSVLNMMSALGCYFMNAKETEAVAKLFIPTGHHKMHTVTAVTGQNALNIASMAGFAVPDNTKLLMAELPGIGDEHPLSAVKLCPVLACYKAVDAAQGIHLAAELIRYGEPSSSSVIHSNDAQAINAFAAAMHTGKVNINTPSAHGAMENRHLAGLSPSASSGQLLGHRDSISQLTISGLINIKRIAERPVSMQWFKIPPKLYFEKGATQYLTNMPEINRILIVADAAMRRLGYIDKVEYYLRKRRKPVQIEVFAEVTPEPALDTIEQGLAFANRIRPDCIIALGGGSVMDAAKAIWLFYEYPDTKLEDLKQRFQHIRKRVYKYPQLGKSAKLVAIPTTSGTGSEVTSYAVITDKADGSTKFPLTDYELTPDVAIIDPEFTSSLPREVVADSGMDVLTHAIEAYVSVMASDFSDGLAMKAIQLVFENLEKSFATGDHAAREKMHNASTIAGMAYANAFLGINHCLAHKLGAQFHIAHGRANAILLPHVIKYNASNPTKFQSYPNYNYYKADERYADIARMLGLPANTAAEGVDSLISAVRKLNQALGIPVSFEAAGVPLAPFEAKVDRLAELAFEDQSATTNPRMPLVSELAELYRIAYYGNYES